jgi:hypothetical protein
MKQRQRHSTGPYDPQTITRAVTHIRLEEDTSNESEECLHLPGMQCLSLS